MAVHPEKGKASKSIKRKRSKGQIAGTLGGKDCPPGQYWSAAQGRCVSIVDDKPV